MDQPQPEKKTSFDEASAAARPPAKKQKTNSGLRDFMSILGVLLSALVLAFCLIHFVFQSYQVDGPSMEPTLKNKDYLIIWKVPKTIADITNKSYMPKRGDVIVFNVNEDATYKQLIKRVIALPGERVTVKDGVVTVYNQAHPDGFDPDASLPYGTGNKLGATPGNDEATVKASEVYVLGDNRDNSRDSRYFGPVHSQDILGKLVLRLMPLSDAARF